MREKEDQVETDSMDYWVQGVNIGLFASLKLWGAIYLKGQDRWLLQYTNCYCPDYQAIERLGCTLVPIVFDDDFGRPKKLKIIKIKKGEKEK